MIGNNLSRTLLFQFISYPLALTFLTRCDSRIQDEEIVYAYIAVASLLCGLLFLGIGLKNSRGRISQMGWVPEVQGASRYAKASSASDKIRPIVPASHISALQTILHHTNNMT